MLLDVTHTLSADVPTWDGICGFQLALDSDYSDHAGPVLFRTQCVECRAGMGTHIDAPAHCFPGAATIENLQLGDLITNCVMIDVSSVADESYLAPPDCVVKFEREHGKISANTFVIFYTGWDRRWPDKQRYRNELQFPSIHEETAALLLERNVAGLGIDTLSPDTGRSAFPVHRLMLGAGKYLIESVANARNLPPIGARLFALPMKLEGGTEAPVRLLACLK